MSIEQEIAAGKGLSLAQAAASLPGRRGQRTSPQTVLRWALKGTRGASGSVVRLEAARLGASWVTSREALARFISALSVTTRPQQPAPRSAALEAGKVLKELGL
ncbi:DUF1580 domain-containing protein [Limnoglobus roseus]|uniref:DUF1580 domain-containing protein n=1 Tax=Limnoglobus roseus TaxID=2598579 RepID=A0A5C1AN06_9BACT|nr:DUF1580 domain-containing protein [Limnoglobus roseus]QEL19503.1 hypothetical protein PX52LOC_06577 [Limnoglobus roseus]